MERNSKIEREKRGRETEKEEERIGHKLIVLRECRKGSA